MNQTEIIGRNLAHLREKRSLTQEAVAAYLRVARPLVSYYESGQRAVPLHHLEKIADLFCVEMGDLISGRPDSQTVSRAFAFRTEGLTELDLKSIGDFQKVVRNYMKMLRVKNEKEKGSRD